jgi:hypothetical protein
LYPIYFGPVVTVLAVSLKIETVWHQLLRLSMISFYS